MKELGFGKLEKKKLGFQGFEERERERDKENEKEIFFLCDWGGGRCTVYLFCTVMVEYTLTLCEFFFFCGPSK